MSGFYWRVVCGRDLSTGLMLVDWLEVWCKVPRESFHVCVHDRNGIDLLIQCLKFAVVLCTCCKVLHIPLQLIRQLEWVKLFLINWSFLFTWRLKPTTTLRGVETDLPSETWSRSFRSRTKPVDQILQWQQPFIRNASCFCQRIRLLSSLMISVIFINVSVLSIDIYE